MNGWRTLFPNAWYITVREFRSRARSRSFIAGTVILAAIAFAATQVPVLIDFAMGASQTHLEVVVRAAGTPADSQVELTGTLNGQNATSDHQPFVVSWLAGGDLAAAQQALASK